MIIIGYYNILKAGIPLCTTDKRYDKAVRVRIYGFLPCILF